MQNNLPFRPTDNSSTTLMKYRLEAEHWSRAFESTRRYNKKQSFTLTIEIIGSVITFFVLFVILICTFCSGIIQRYLTKNSTTLSK